MNSHKSLWTHHIPLLEKNHSGSENCSFLSQKENIYLMDNHRLALWCWRQFLNQNKTQFNFFHLDAHEDAKADLPTTLWEDLSTITLDEFLKLKSDDGNFKKIRWDNYLPVFVHSEQKQIRKSVFVTHDVGKMGYAHQRISAYNLLVDFPKLFVDELQWIVNIDLDYFYAREFKKYPLYHENWIREFFIKLKHHYDQNDIAVMTIALSPECCGSWKNAEKILEIFDQEFSLGINQIKGLIAPENKSSHQ